jgi:hypothetical protein
MESLRETAVLTLALNAAMFAGELDQKVATYCTGIADAGAL